MGVIFQFSSIIYVRNHIFVMIHNIPNSYAVQNNDAVMPRASY
jgi:hypothetical protein